MARFFVGLGLGVFTGWLLNEQITDGLHGFIGFANEKLDAYETEPVLKEQATAQYPATGADGITLGRAIEINNATPEAPVTLTWDEVAAMKISYVKVGLGAGRYKVEEVVS